MPSIYPELMVEFMCWGFPIGFAIAGAQNYLCPNLAMAAAWLHGVRHGMDHPEDKPVTVRRPYQTEATPVDDATDMTFAI